MILLVTLLVVCTQTTTSALPFAGFAPPQGARRLCAEHVNSPTMHITWQSYATADALDEVVAHYQKATGRTATRQADGSHRHTRRANHRRHLDRHPPLERARRR
jgi:hypothetical protein